MGYFAGYQNEACVSCGRTSCGGCSGPSRVAGADEAHRASRAAYWRERREQGIRAAGRAIPEYDVIHTPIPDLPADLGADEYRDVQEFGPFVVGGHVVIVKDSGFEEGQPQLKQIARIVLNRRVWEPADRTYLLVFTDGSSRGSAYTRVTPVKLKSPATKET